MALGVLCILGKEPERLSDGCLIGFSDLELMIALTAYQSSSFFANRTPERSIRWRDGSGSLAPMVHEPINQFADLSWTLRPGA